MDHLALRLNLNVGLTLNHGPQRIYGVETRQFFRKRSGESQRHVMMKLLSYMVFYHPELQVEASASQHFKPDLLRMDAQGRPLQWVDCGQTSLQKLDKISRKNKRTRIDIVKATPGELVAYSMQAETRLRDPERVRYWSFGEGLVERLGELCVARHHILATITPGYEQIYLVVDERHELHADIVWLNREASPVQKPGDDG